MNQRQFADARSINRRMTAHSVLTIVIVCAMSTGSMLLSLHSFQDILARVSASLTMLSAQPLR